jgi:glycosyltransferase involved in cell wall biosynthesis
MAMLKRAILILFVRLDVGGIETYFAKLSHQLATHRRVIVFSLTRYKDAGLVASFDERVLILNINDLFKFLESVRGGVDIIATGRNTLLFGLLLRLIFPNKSALRLGVYSQYELIERSRGYFALIYKFAYSIVGAKNIFFCTQGLKDRMVQLDAKFLESDVVPLSVSLPTFFRYQANEVGAIKLVTIGRFVGFKKYLQVLPGLVAELSARGLDVCLEIYGYGPLEDSLKQAVVDLNVSSKIRFMGKLDPGLIDEAVQNCDIFIGSGSVLLEVASRGIPSVVCIDENSSATSPGFLHELPLYFTSEERPFAVMTSMPQMVERYSLMSVDERRAFCRASFEYCVPYYPGNVAGALLNSFQS